MKGGFPSRVARSGFSLLELMIVVSLLGLLTVLAIPSFLKGRKQSQGQRVVNDARIIDTAIDVWAMDNHKTDGEVVDLDGVVTYTKAGTFRTTDVLGNPYGIGQVGDEQVRVSATTKKALSGVGIDWGAY